MKLKSKFLPIGQCHMQNASQGTIGKIQIIWSEFMISRISDQIIRMVQKGLIIPTGTNTKKPNETSKRSKKIHLCEVVYSRPLPKRRLVASDLRSSAHFFLSSFQRASNRHTASYEEEISPTKPTTGIYTVGILTFSKNNYQNPHPGEIIVKISKNKWFTSLLLFEIERHPPRTPPLPLGLDIDRCIKLPPSNYPLVFISLNSLLLQGFW